MKVFFFFLLFVYEIDLYLFFCLFDVCVKQCCPIINWSLILPSCSNKKKKKRKKEKEKETQVLNCWTIPLKK